MSGDMSDHYISGDATGLVGRGQGCCSTSYEAQGSPTAKNNLVPNVSVQVRGPGSDQEFTALAAHWNHLGNCKSCSAGVAAYSSYIAPVCGRGGGCHVVQALGRGVCGQA